MLPVSRISLSLREMLLKTFLFTPTPRLPSTATCSRVQRVRLSKTTRPISCSPLRYKAPTGNPLPRKVVLASLINSLGPKLSLIEASSSGTLRVEDLATFNGQSRLSVGTKVAPSKLTPQVQSLCACCSRNKRESLSETRAQVT